MKILCKVLPEQNTCCCCIADQLDGITEHLDCYDCLDRIPDYEILQFGHSLFIGDWAMVLSSDGKVERVKLDRVKRVRTFEPTPPVSEAAMKLDRLIFNLERQVNKHFML